MRIKYAHENFAMVWRLRELVRAEQEQRWLHENREAISNYNRRVAEHGLLADETGSHDAADVIDKEAYP
jgi:Post-segregation antitoxin CcdA